ncbi:ATP-binding protein [Streptomyces sp. NPDC058622]|uniref:ATP-binding protein n=1 Tax=Streptomyces sp. NPDC058622 TaxID=3346562 RepID=UPI0036575A51
MPSWPAPPACGPPPRPGAWTTCSELVANAIRHTDGPCALHLELQDDSIDVCVADRSPRLPQLRTPGTDGTGGWGWFVIKRLATRIHIKAMPDGGKTICAALPW